MKSLVTANIVSTRSPFKLSYGIGHTQASNHISSALVNGHCIAIVMKQFDYVTRIKLREIGFVLFPHVAWRGGAWF